MKCYCATAERCLDSCVDKTACFKDAPSAASVVSSQGKSWQCLPPPFGTLSWDMNSWCEAKCLETYGEGWECNKFDEEGNWTNTCRWTQKQNPIHDRSGCVCGCTD